MQLRTETAMHAKNSVFYYRAHRHVVEANSEISPKGNRVSALALIVESVSSVDSLALVIASK